MRLTFGVETSSTDGDVRPDTHVQVRKINPAGEKPRNELIACISRNARVPRYSRLMASTDYYVVFSVGVNRLIERAGKASGRDGLKGRCAGNDFVAAAEVATKVLADGPPPSFTGFLSEIGEQVLRAWRMFMWACELSGRTSNWLSRS
jgi:hypothetical protein